MKHLIILFTALMLVGCNGTNQQIIVGEWTIVEYYENNMDYSHTINSTNNQIVFHDDAPFSVCTHLHQTLTQAGWMGNWNAYWVSGDMLYDGCTPRGQMIWQGNNRVKIISLVNLGSHVILER